MTRTDNNPIDENALLSALAQVMLPNTNLQASGGTIYLNDRTDIEMARAKYPTCVLETGKELEAKVAWRTWKNRITIEVTYIDRWDRNPNLSVSAIRKNIRTDLGLLLANLRDNGNLTISSSAHAIRIAHITVNGYGMQSDKSSPVQTISCHATLDIELPPYVTAL